MKSGFGWVAAYLLIGSVTAAALIGCSSASQPDPIVDPTLTSIQANIFDARCSCHRLLVPPQGRLNLNNGESYQNLVLRQVEATTNRYRYRVVPGAPDSSFLMAKITGDLLPTEGDRMPSHEDILNDQQISAIRDWIKSGALNN